MSAPSAILRGRAAAESLMTLTLAWYEPNGWTTGTDKQVPAFTSRGTTPGKLQGSAGSDSTTRWVSVGGVERPVLQAGLHVPAEGLVPGIDWEAEVTAVGDLADIALLGRRYRVTGLSLKSFATARRLDVVEVTPEVTP
ncbi:MAG: DUF6093 family protein [Nocardioides sp.]|uniref:DUF6093 family protein n=1 Tax=Nocardioides sp. TaxID=35761 RepID=UPI0039E3B522